MNSRSLRRTRLLLIITGLAVGGATNVVLDIGAHFNDHPEFEVDLLAGPIPPGRSDMSHVAREYGISTQIIPSLVNQISPLNNMMAIMAIRRFIARGRYDIVHTHSTVAGVIGRLAASSSGVPVVLHHIHGWGFCNEMPKLTRTLSLNLERFCAKLTTRLIVVSARDIQKGLSHGIGRNDQYVLIPNGVDLAKFRQPVDNEMVRTELGLRPDFKIVGMIGRLDKQKNPQDFIRAAGMVANSYTQVQFVFVGDGPLRSECESLIIELGMQNKIILLGCRNDVHRILPALDVFAMSSLWEGLPLACLEAMSAGKPIVANNVDGVQDVVRDGETGFLVTAHDPSEMAERILLLLEEEALCWRMGQSAQWRSNSYSVRGMVEKVEALYKDLSFDVRYVHEGGAEIPKHA